MLVLPRQQRLLDCPLNAACTPPACSVVLQEAIEQVVLPAFKADAYTMVSAGAYVS